ncbi:helix-turn-helix domain-containing protein [Streptomyces sp. NBC_00582]|uniref:helix-turn-helix domain-containing protein n=1 Tax=Streptomyces sp. NBC_00582 TaxID=2975783 RepID=UPI0010632F41|nr:XRE family transcriptional regulator [Streptomyces sp. NBC_00582]WUB62387.1 XRE family transcriptional regulator [Streptomyces sp. NBC_00582]
MPRWRDLPDELDPHVREFAEQLRGVVDRAGLSLATVADRTGYATTSWEKYLDGRLLAPRGAVVALAEVTGTPSARLITLWEPAQRAWSRAELRQARTVDDVRIGRARAAPGEFGPPRGGPREPGRAGASPSGAGGGAGRRPRAQRPALFLAGVAGVLGLAVGAFLLTDAVTPGRTAEGSGSPSPSARTSAALPSGVLCAGSGCTGEDAERMGCSGDSATTAKSTTVGPAVVEVRYSRICGAAWGRIVRAVPGDVVRVTVGSHSRTGTVGAAGETIAYTPMIAVRGPGQAKACAVLASGVQGCTG